MISVIIPAYNEENAVGDVVSQVRQVLDAVEHEVIVVDDGSTDSTSRKALEAGAIVISHPHNIGYGRSLKDGIQAARYDTIVISDADGSYPVEDIPKLVEQHQKQGFNMVVGQRTGVNYYESFSKRNLRYFLTRLVEFTAGRRIPDINSGFRVFSKGELVPYFQHLCDAFSFTTSMTLAYMMTGKYVTYTPIAYRKRVGETKVRLFRDSLRTMQIVVQAILYYNPIKLFLVIGLLQLLAAMVGVGLSLIFHIPGAFAFGMLGILLLFPIFSLGLLADLLRKIMEVRNEKTGE